MNSERPKDAGLEVTKFYNVTIFEKSKSSKAFEKWFKTIFSVQHPDISKDFLVFWEVDKEDGEDYLHFISNNIFFNTQQLIILFVDDMNSSAN
jgi:hypothetical protein